MINFDQFLTATKTHMQPEPRALATASTLQQLSTFIPTDVTLADLAKGWSILSEPAHIQEDAATIQRRVTCGELAQLAMPLTTVQGDIRQAIKTWHAWAEAFKSQDDPRQAAMSKTFARELAELQRAVR